jgi:hypothetical protein
MVAMNVIEDMVSEAILAPSSHNTQPWAFEADSGAIQLFADRTRALSVNDPEDRELTISCGCALMNLRVAAAARGLATSVEAFPDREDPDFLARVAFEGELDEALAALSSSISARRTYRKAFDTFDDTGVLNDLVAAAEAEGVWLDVLDGARRKAAGELVSQGDAAQWADPRWRRELASWMHPRRRGDGLTIPWLAIPAAQLIVRSFDMGKGIGAKDGEIAEHSPLLAVLGTTEDRQVDWLRAGQGLERVLLTACNSGLQASYLNQPIQVAHLRDRLQDLCTHNGLPQILLRLGRPSSELAATPRRALREVLNVRD